MLEAHMEIKMMIQLKKIKMVKIKMVNGLMDGVWVLNAVIVKDKLFFYIKSYFIQI